MAPILASAQQTSTFYPVADTFTQQGASVSTNEFLDVNGTQNPDRVAYIKFDLSAVKSVVSAEFGMYKRGASRNDTIVTGRWRNLGLLDYPTNTVQNWNEIGLTDPTFTLGAEWTNVQFQVPDASGTNLVWTNLVGVDPNQLVTLDADDGAAVTEVVVNNDSAPSTIVGPALASFLTQRAQNGGLATIINMIPANNRGYGFWSKEAANPALRPYLTLTYIPNTGLSNILWTVGNGTWDIATTANWENQVGGAALYGPEGFGIGNEVNFEDTVSSPGDITVTLDSFVTPESITADTAKTFTISGLGAINGPGSITKNGTGTLALETYNGSFTGPVNINGGTVRFSSGGLGFQGQLSLDGGTIAYNSGNLDDISADTSVFPTAERLNLLAGGGTIDSGGNDVSYSVGIAAGPGSLTKTGAGILYLAGTNSYSGDTYVNQGSLGVSGGAIIPNSPNIIVAAGASLDASFAASYTLSSASSQKLSGLGSFDGTVIVPSGTSISPATNGVVGSFSVIGTFGNGALQMDGGTLEIDINSSTHDTIPVTGNLALNSGTIALNVSGVLPNGTYTLITYSGSITSGGVGALLVTGFSQPGQIAFLSSATPGQVQLIVATQGTASLVWQGSVNSTWDVEGAANWLSNGLSAVFFQGDSVTFNATGSAQPSVDLQGALFPTAVTVDATTAYTLMTSAGGKLSGATPLTKNNTGTLNILTDNNNTGLITINGGSVNVGDGAANAHIGDGGFANNGALAFNPAAADNRTVGAISGTGTVAQNGAAVITIAGDATYTGGTTIGSGASLSFGNGGALAAIATSGITNDGTVIYNSSSSQTAPPISGNGGLTKRGTGSLTVNTLGAGDTAVEGGSLTLGGSLLAAGLTVNDGAVLDINGFDQTVTGLVGANLGVITNSAASGTNVLTINSAANSTANVLINNGESNAAIAVVKSGAGVLTRETPVGASTYRGGTTINGPGGINLRDDDQLGTGPVIIDGGLIQYRDQRDLINPLIIASTGNFQSDGNMQFRGPISGDSNAVMNLYGNSATSGRTMTFETGGALDNFFGTIVYSGTNAGVNARLNLGGGAGDNEVTLNGSNATWDMGVNGTFLFSRDGGVLLMGHLIGTSDSSLRGAGSSDQKTVYGIGYKNLPIDFPGTITDQLPVTGPEINLLRYVEIRKEGTSTLTLSGTNMYSGPTVVNGGTLNVTAVGGLDNSRAIIVNGSGVLDTTGLGGTLTLGAATTNGQSLGGDGTISGNVVASATGVVTVAPGQSAGELTISGSLTLAANSVVNMELDVSSSPSNDVITAASINEAGTLNVTNIGPMLSAGQQFTLFSEPVNAFSAVNLATEDAYATYTWTDELATFGRITVATVTPKAIAISTNLVVTPGVGSVDVEWPPSHLGSTLETNAVSLVDTNWFPWPGSDLTNLVTIPVNPNAAQVFFRLRYP